MLCSLDHISKHYLQPVVHFKTLLSASEMPLHIILFCTAHFFCPHLPVHVPSTQSSWSWARPELFIFAISRVFVDDSVIGGSPILNWSAPILHFSSSPAPAAAIYVQLSGHFEISGGHAKLECDVCNIKLTYHIISVI